MIRRKEVSGDWKYGLGLLFLMWLLIPTQNYIYTPSSLISLTTRTPPIYTQKQKEKVFPKSKEFESQYNELRKELEEHLPDRVKFPYADAAYGSKFISKFKNNQGKIDKNWRIFPVKMAGAFVDSGKQMFPKLASLCEDRNIVSSFYSVLEPKTKIPLHVGYYKGVLRYQLGMIIPKQREDVFICVNQQKYNWTEGEGVIFDDTFPHQVYNNTDQVRVILYLDVIRPLPPVLNEMNRGFFILAAKSKAVKKENDKLEKKLKIIK